MEEPIHFYNQQGEKLAGSLHQPKQHAGCGVVFGHCFTCTRHTRIIREACDALATEKFLALRFDFSGNGQSEGEFSKSTYSKQIAEMMDAAGVIFGKGARRLGLAGHSMGAVIAVLTAARMERIQAVCTLAGRLTGLNASNFFNRRQIKELEDTGKVAFTKQYDLARTVKSLKTPVMVVHGDADEIIPVKDAYLAKTLNPEHMDLTVISGADHMFSNAVHRSQTVKLVVKWFKEHLHGSF